MKAAFPQAVACPHLLQTGGCTQLTCLRLLHGGKFAGAVHPQFVDFFTGFLSVRCQKMHLVARGQLARLHLDQHHTLSSRVVSHLPGNAGKFLDSGQRKGQAVQSAKQLLDALILQSRPSKAGEKLPFGDQLRHLVQPSLLLIPAVQVHLHQLFVLCCNLFDQFFAQLRTLSKASRAITDRAAHPLLQLVQHLVGTRTGPVGLVEKEKHRHPIAFEQLPHLLGVRLYPFHTADQHNGVIHRLNCPFHLRTEVGVTGRVQQPVLMLPDGKWRVVGKDGDASLPLQTVVVQKSVLVVHPSSGADASCMIKQLLGKGGLACIDVRHHADA